MISRFVANLEKCRKYALLGGSAHIITILHRGGYQNLLQYYMGGVFPVYYNITMGGGGGVSRDPKFVLRNIWTAPYCNQKRHIQIFIQWNSNTANAEIALYD